MIVVTRWWDVFLVWVRYHDGTLDVRMGAVCLLLLLLLLGKPWLPSSKGTVAHRARLRFVTSHRSVRLRRLNVLGVVGVDRSLLGSQRILRRGM